MAPELPNSVFRSAILDLLASIRNQSPGDIQEQFTGPPGFWPGGFRLEWWVGEQDILLRAALTLAEVVPGVLERHTVQVVRNKILSTLKAEVDHFNWAPFISIARGPVVSLLECVKPGGVEAIVSALTTWATEVDRAMFLMPVRGLRPASDVVSSTFLWVSCNTAPEVLSTVLHFRALPDTLSLYPPWLTGPKSGQQNLGDGDSLLGIVAPGWQDGVSELRRIAGAICCAVSDEHVLFRSIPYWSNVFLLSEAGAQVLNAFAPILPNVGNVRVLHPPELDIFRATMAPRADAEHDRRFRIALQFLSTGWVLTGTPEFMNYFISLDALLGKSNGKWDKATRTRAASAMQAHDAEGKLDLAIKIRHELLHGRCNSVERSRWYFDYYRRYHLDPTHGLLHAVRQCLRNDPS